MFDWIVSAALGFAAGHHTVMAVTGRPVPRGLHVIFVIVLVAGLVAHFARHG